MTDDILLQVNRPAQYTGGEWNVSKKDFAQSNIRLALCFPDLYEVGMSNLGLRLLYGVANNIEDACCERFFSPNLDMEAVLRKENAQIFSLESRRKLGEFDLAGFSLGHELNYTNVLNILDLARIPLESVQRDASFPLIMGGGPAVLNPEPLHEFFDFFVIGEAEEALVEIIDLYRKFKTKFKQRAMSKQDLLLELSRIEGVYVPSLYEVQYDSSGRISAFRPRISGLPEKIKKRSVKDLNHAYFPVNWLVPYIPIVNDRITLEIMRGCPNHCRFCQARVYYGPFRLRQKENILELASLTYQNTGYEEISLGGLSVSDYPGIQNVVADLLTLFKYKVVALSLPSIKPKDMVGDLSALISTIRKTGLTFAPEAGSVRLNHGVSGA